MAEDDLAALKLFNASITLPPSFDLPHLPHHGRHSNKDEQEPPQL
jgi:hypothetical protein